MKRNEREEKKMKVLIVEDEVKTASFLKKGLVENGYQVDISQDGEEGLRQAFGFSYDLLILDVMMPKRDGLSVLSQLRKDGKDTLVLFLTAKDSLDDRVRGLNTGADAYLTKPFAFSELLATVRTLLRRTPQRSSQEVIVIDDLVIDLPKHKATRAGKKLDLTPKEFALLYLLARNMGEIITRSTITEQIWDIHFDSGTNVVDVHVRRLRAKIDDPFERKLIKTIRGTGYLLEAAS